MPFGLAVWTLGSHARRNLVPSIAATPSLRLVGVFTRDAGVSASIAQTFNAKAYSTSDEMLRDPEVSAVIIAGPNGVHHAHALAALRAGKHVFVEKTLATSPREVEELISESEASGLVLAECFMYKHHAQFQALSEIVASGRLGPVQSVCARFGFPHLAGTDIRYSRALAGGALNDVGAYCLSAVLSVCGPDPERVHAVLTTPPLFEVDVSGSALLTFPDGATAHAAWGFGRSYISEIDIWFRSGRLTAERAFAKPAQIESAIKIVHQEGNRRETVTIAPDNHFVRMLEELARCTRTSEGAAKCRMEARQQAGLMERVRRSSDLQLR